MLQVGAKISGTITNADDQPVTGICFEIVGNDSVGEYEGFDTSGSYVINQLVAGTYQMGFFGGCGNRGSYAPDWYNNQPSENTATPITLAHRPELHCQRRAPAGRDDYREGHRRSRARAIRDLRRCRIAVRR